MQDNMLRVTLIGSGNVATRMASALKNVAEIVEVYSRSLPNAEMLALQIGGSCRAIDSYEALSTDSDLYIISLADDAIADAIKSTSRITDGLWVHTSGSTPMSVFCGHKHRYGVLYPLQTLSKDKPIDFASVPLLVEGCDEKAEAEIAEIASMMTENVKHVDSEGRVRLHIAAVFACNFTNYMWSVADDLLHQSGLDITYLKPLLDETLSKTMKISPAMAQTGPARRGDQAIMQRHESMLSGDVRRVYEIISEQIYKKYNE